MVPQSEEVYSLKIDRTRNATRNITSGIVLKIYQLLAPFVIRTIMIYCLGMEYVGLNTLFTSILQVLNLAELGVGSAMVYSMYKPIATDDSKTICALMNLYKIYYRIIGLIVLVGGIIIMPFLPNLISGDIPEGINLYVLYILNLGATVLSYWLYAYKNCLLTAHQRMDVVNKVTIVVTTGQYVFQGIFLLLLRNYYAYLIVALLSQVVLNIVTAYFATKMYPNYKAQGSLSKTEIRTINQRVKDLFTSKLGSIIVNSADTIVISAFLGLSVLGVYNNYYYILNAVLGFVTIIFTACTAGIGNSLIMDSQEKNLNDLNKLTFLIAWIGAFCCCCFLGLYQPFMRIWVGEQYLLSYSCVVCLVIYFFIRVINQVLIVYKDAAGMWHEDRFRPLCTALANLIMNLILVQFIGLYGILLSTVLSTLIIGMPWVIHNLFTVQFKMGQAGYVKRLLLYTAATVLACIISYLLSLLVRGSDYIQIVVNLIISCIVPNLIFICFFHKTRVFKESIRLIDNMIGKRISLAHRLCIKLMQGD